MGSAIAAAIVAMPSRNRQRWRKCRCTQEGPHNTDTGNESGMEHAVLCVLERVRSAAVLVGAAKLTELLLELIPCGSSATVSGS